VPPTVNFNSRGRAKIGIALLTGKKAHDNANRSSSVIGIASAYDC
jgi:hypothetical protein